MYQLHLHLIDESSRVCSLVTRLEKPLEQCSIGLLMLHFVGEGKTTRSNDFSMSRSREVAFCNEFHYSKMSLRNC